MLLNVLFMSCILLKMPPAMHRWSVPHSLNLLWGLCPQTLHWNCATLGRVPCPEFMCQTRQFQDYCFVVYVSVQYTDFIPCSSGISFWLCFSIFSSKLYCDLAMLCDDWISARTLKLHGNKIFCFYKNFDEVLREWNIDAVSTSSFPDARFRGRRSSWPLRGNSRCISDRL